MNRGLPILLLCTFLTACVGESDSHGNDQSVDLSSVQLHASDVGTGFYLQRHYTLNTQQTAIGQYLDPSQYSRHGGGASTSESFARKQLTDTGITKVFSQIFTFTSTANARWGYAQLRSAIAHSGTIGMEQQHVNVGATPTPLPTFIAILKHPVHSPVTLYSHTRAPLIGKATSGFTNTSAAYAGEYVFTNQLLLFKQGHYCVVVHISGNYAQVPMSKAASLARTIDTRIHALKN
jgi:hypothetical protein